MSAVDFTLYTYLVRQLQEGQLDETIDLSIVQHRRPIPEAWPVVFTGLVTFRKSIRYFTVSDGKTTVACYGSVPDELYERVAHLEPGAIIHLIDSEPRFNSEQNAYVLDVQDVMTLKAYENHVNAMRIREAERLARMRTANTFYDDAVLYSSV
ncbi:MAG: hypothetical protein VKK59_05165 [Vampirovibrionales bacterium]|nr:hypothetical protein [Vampirovibrionales bacterium]